MKEYTSKQIKELEKNPYVYKVTKHKLYYTAKFKEDFWVSYQAGNAPRKILTDFGFDLSIFGQKQIDSLVQHIKKRTILFFRMKQRWENMRLFQEAFMVVLVDDLQLLE